MNDIPKLELKMPFAFVTTTWVLSTSSGQIMWSMPGEKEKKGRSHVPMMVGCG